MNKVFCKHLVNEFLLSAYPVLLYANPLKKKNE